MFIDKLNKLCKKLDLEYKINKGGCCFIAYLISKQLEKLNIPYELVVYDDEDRCDLDADSLTFDETAKTLKVVSTSTSGYQGIRINKSIPYNNEKEAFLCVVTCKNNLNNSVVLHSLQ